MKNQLRLLFGLILAVLSLTSCEEMRQDMTFNKDGSGSVSMHLVMGGEMMEMIKMMGEEGGMMGEDAEEYEDEEMESEDADETDAGYVDEMEDEEDYSLDGLFGDVKDTSFVFYDMIPDSLRGTIKNEELLKQVTMIMASDEETESMSVGLTIDFDNIDQIAEIQESIQSLKKDDGSLPGSGEMLSFIDEGMTWEPGHIHMPPMDMGDQAELLSLQEEMSEDGEGMMMMQMFMGELTFDINITAPGKITKCDCPEGVIEGNTVSYSISMMDMMTGQLDLNSPTDIYYEH